MTNTAQNRIKMLEGQILTNRVLDKNIIAAVANVAREDFVPDNYKNNAYVDEDILLGEARVILQPLVFARLLKLADIKPSDKVLDIAVGTGYSSAVIGQLAANVVALESDSKLLTAAKANIGKTKNITVVAGNIAAGAPEHKSFDAIIINGGVANVPEAILKQLKNGGRLVAVVQNYIMVYTKTDKQTSAARFDQAYTHALPEFAKPAGFEF